MRRLQEYFAEVEKPGEERAPIRGGGDMMHDHRIAQMFYFLK